MGKEIKRIRINKLSSENNIFDEIIFHDGINLILGEKYDDSTSQGRKTNGVGKSMSVEFLGFGLLCEYEKSRISKIPVEILPEDEDIILEIRIGEEDIVIRRNRYARKYRNLRWMMEHILSFLVPKVPMHMKYRKIWLNF